MNVFIKEPVVLILKIRCQRKRAMPSGMNEFADILAESVDENMK
jgi:hypothetical protein